MLHLSSSGPSTSSLSRIQSTASISQPMAGLQTSQETPFAQQFNYHLQDLAIVRRNQPLKPDGKLRVHLPDISNIEVDYNRRETVEVLRERLQEIIDTSVNIKNKPKVSQYYLVSPRGTIDDGMTLDEYFLTPGCDILLIRKGIKDRQQLANRRFWLRSREAKTRGEPRPSTTTMTRKGAAQAVLPALNKHRVTPYISSDDRVQEIKNSAKAYRKH